MNCAPATSKFCRKCNKSKPIGDFRLRKNGKRYSYCKLCAALELKAWRAANPNYHKEWKRKNSDKERLSNRKEHLKWNFGISLADFEKMNAAQKGLCAICRQPSTHTLGVDHNHNTNKIRGLLCKACNRGLGLFGDSILRLVLAMLYLENATVHTKPLETVKPGRKPGQKTSNTPYRRRRNKQLRRAYRIDLKQYEDLNTQQRGLCKICLNKPNSRALHVDHNHTTGVIRGLLCSACNRGLGMFGDSVELIKNAIDYLNQYDCPEVDFLQRRQAS